MAFFKKLKERLFKSSSKIEEGLDAIVEDGGAEETVAAAEVAETVEEIVDADPVLDTAPEPEPEPEPEPVDEVLAEEAAALSEVQREAEILSDDPVDADLIHPDPIP
ncbi:MAG: signal recognition particle-docking protein FtsY, partial [Pseudomonadota bacterium]